ncbi:unnamed protein product [Mytilus edulis]|uniref:Uncharacterized protein n=1 Tax=Mytilus edulis TaxID=6550 RepID=A0A8S3RHC6_MYTED|nr:unnamed protein product [Mytilus edulis]
MHLFESKANAEEETKRRLEKEQKGQVVLKKHHGNFSNYTFNKDEFLVEIKSLMEKGIVNVSSGLSPGLYTRKLATLRDIQARKRKAVAITTEAKLRRIALKASRNQSSSTFEVREGDEKILEIPAPKNKPVENDSKPDISTMTHIYFDIEATGLGRTSHITQISARRGLETFSKYILPAREITPKAAEVTGLTFQNGSLYLLDKIVPAVGAQGTRLIIREQRAVDRKRLDPPTVFEVQTIIRVAEPKAKEYIAHALVVLRPHKNVISYINSYLGVLMSMGHGHRSGILEDMRFVEYTAAIGRTRISNGKTFHCISIAHHKTGKSGLGKIVLSEE